MTHEEEPRLILLRQTFEFRDRSLVHFFGLVCIPVCIGDNLVAAAAGVTADVGGGVTVVTENFGESADCIGERALMTEGNAVGVESVHTGYHGSVTRRGGDGGAVHLIEYDTAVFDVAVDVGSGKTLVAVERHMVAAEAVDTKEQNIRSLGHGRFSFDLFFFYRGVLVRIFVWN